MNFRSISLFLSSLCYGIVAHGASGFHMYGQGDTFADWGAVPFDFAQGKAEWPIRPDVGGMMAYSHLELGASYDNWGVARLRRDQVFATFHEDVIDVFVDENNQLRSGSLENLVLNGGRSYNMSLCLDYFSATGARIFGPGWKSKRLQLNWSVNLYNGENFFDGCLQGQVQVSPPNSSLSLKSSFSKDLLLNQAQYNASGFGASINIRARWQAWRQLYVSTHLQDLFGRVQWNRAATAQADIAANASPQPQGKNNYLFEPQVSTAYRRESYLQKLPLLSNSELGWGFSNGFSLYSRLRTTPIVNYVYLGSRYNWSRTLYLELAYQLEPGGVSFVFSSRWFQFGILSDATQLRHASQLAVFMQLGFP